MQIINFQKLQQNVVLAFVKGSEVVSFAFKFNVGALTYGLSHEYTNMVFGTVIFSKKDQIKLFFVFCFFLFSSSVTMTFC